MDFFESETKSYHVGQDLGPETLSTEYKEFCIHDWTLYFDENDFDDLIHRNKQLDQNSFNNAILNEINISYIKKYVPKYVGNYSKACIDGSIYIGVNDDGSIVGIPYYGTLDVNAIHDMIMQTIVNIRGIRYTDDLYGYDYDDTVSKMYYDAINIHVYELDTSRIVSNHKNVSRKIYDIETNKRGLITKWANYKKENNKWSSKMMKYRGKLSNYLFDDSLRNGIIGFITQTFTSNRSFDRSKLDEILDFFNKDPEYYKDIVFGMDYIESIMNDKYNPIKWLLDYKDSMLQMLKKSKPVRPVIKPEENLYSKFCCEISNIRPYIHNNIKYYIIKINIPTFDGTSVQYRFSENSEWLSRERIMLSSGPSCV